MCINGVSVLFGSRRKGNAGIPTPYTEFGEVRTVIIENEPWFVGKDVAEALGFTNSRDAIATHVFDDDKGVERIDTLGGKQNMVVINESGLYALVFCSRLPSAKRFKHWVTSEVLPAIRKTSVTNYCSYSAFLFASISLQSLTSTHLRAVVPWFVKCDYKCN